MIYIGNLLLRTMLFKEFNNSLYFKIYGHLFSKIAFCTMVQKPFKTKEKKKFSDGNPGPKPRSSDLKQKFKNVSIAVSAPRITIDF